MILALLSLAVLLVCGYMVGRELLSRQKEKEDFEQLAKLVTVKSPAASAAPAKPSNLAFLFLAKHVSTNNEAVQKSSSTSKNTSSYRKKESSYPYGSIDEIAPYMVSNVIPMIVTL